MNCPYTSHLHNALRLRRQVGPPPEQGEDLAAQLVVLQHLWLSAGNEPDPHLLPRRQGLRIGHNLLVGNHSQLRRGEQLPVGLPDPEGPQPHGIDAEHAELAVAGDDRGRSLGGGRKVPPEPAVHRLQLGRNLLHGAEHRRKDQFHRLEQG